MISRCGRPIASYYDKLVTALRADTEHVYSVTDLWADPITRSAAQSRDGRAADLMVRLSGMLGTAQASDSVAVVRDTVHRLGPPPGLHVYVTGPGSTLTDEFAAIDHQMLLITAATVLVIMLLLLIVYRSPVAAAIPLISVGLALAVARPLVALLGNHGAVEVSLFSVALVAAMILGAGTDYAIFLIGRYHEGRRRGIEPATALVDAYRGVAPVVIGSALTMAAALACLSLAKVGMFRSTGIPCAIGVLVGMAAALTLTPALIGCGRPARHAGAAAIGDCPPLAAYRCRGRPLARAGPGGQRRIDRCLDLAAGRDADGLERTRRDSGGSRIQQRLCGDGSALSGQIDCYPTW